jgi:hypothetical protein
MYYNKNNRRHYCLTIVEMKILKTVEIIRFCIERERAFK